MAKTYTVADVDAEMNLLRRDPEALVRLITQYIEEDPSDPHHYFTRHLGWVVLKRFDLALADLDQAIALRDQPIVRLSRGDVLARLGRHKEAIEDFVKGEALDPLKWQDIYGPLHQAASYAELGQEGPALAACARLTDDHWLPTIDGLPGGDKAEVTEQIARRAAEVARRRHADDQV